jgi:hypothetical protein
MADDVWIESRNQVPEGGNPTWPFESNHPVTYTVALPLDRPDKELERVVNSFSRVGLQVTSYDLRTGAGHPQYAEISYGAGPSAWGAIEVQPSSDDRNGYIREIWATVLFLAQLGHDNPYIDTRALGEFRTAWDTIAEYALRTFPEEA